MVRRTSPIGGILGRCPSCPALEPRRKRFQRQSRGMRGRYRQTPTEVTDNEILAKHPAVKIWEAVMPYLLEFNDGYTQGQNLYDSQGRCKLNLLCAKMWFLAF